MKRHAILFLVICLGYLCTLNSADFGSIGDGQVMLDMAVNLHQFGDLIVGYTVDQDKGIVTWPGLGGRYGIGYSLVEQIPLLFVGPVERSFGEGSSNVLFPMTNMVVIGLTALLVALSLQAMGRPFRTGALAAAAFAFGTFVWPYVSYDFSEPVQALCVAAAFFFSVRAVKGRPASRLDLAMAATALGFGVMTKPTLLILAPGFALYLWTGLTGPSSRRARPFAWFGLTLAAWGLLIGGVNLHRFGSFLEFGYGRESGQFTTPLAAGLYYLLLGPNRGLVPYAPVALMLPLGLWAARRVDRREVILLASSFAALVLVIAKWWGWEGGACWGPRLILPLLPLVTIGAALCLDRVRWSPWAFSACAVAGLAVNLLGVLLNFLIWMSVVSMSGQRVPLAVEGRPAREYVVKEGRKEFPLWVAMYYAPALSPIRGHAWLLRLRYFDTPFPAAMLRDRSRGVPPTVRFGPAEVPFARMGPGHLLDGITSAHLWLWGTMAGRSREPGRSPPVVGLSFIRLGEAAAANGDVRRALECYGRASALMPSDPSLREKIEELGRRKATSQPLEGGATSQR